ncbi:MAG: DMT family transporter [Firmicutes bacterium]|nr:DMT family transporter [Bacillota bacterium]
MTIFAGNGDLRLVTQVPPYLFLGGLFDVVIVFSVVSAVQTLGINLDDYRAVGYGALN